MRTHRLFRFVIASLFPITLAACSGAPTPAGGTSGPSEESSSAASPVQPSSAAPLTGAEMFRGFVMGQGRGASLFGPADPRWLAKGQSAVELGASFADIQRTARSRGATAEELQKLEELARRVESGELTPEALGTRLSDVGDQIISAITVQNPTFFDAFRAAMTSGDRTRIKDAMADAARLTRESRPTESAAARSPESGRVPILIFDVWTVLTTPIIICLILPAATEQDLQHDMMIDRLATDLAGQ